MVEKVIQLELCKKLKFDNSTKWYMHKPESVQEDEVHIILWDYKIQTDDHISARKQDLVIVNKKERPRRMVDFVVPLDHRVKTKENE